MTWRKLAFVLPFNYGFIFNLNLFTLFYRCFHMSILISYCSFIVMPLGVHPASRLIQNGRHLQRMVKYFISMWGRLMSFKNQVLYILNIKYKSLLLFILNFFKDIEKLKTRILVPMN